MAWAPDYTTRTLLKTYLDIQHDDINELLDLWITAASRNVDKFCHRQFGQVASLETREYVPVWDRHLSRSVVRIDDVTNTTGFALRDENGAAVTDYKFYPLNALSKGKAYEELRTTSRLSASVTADARWGWNAVPSSVPTGMLLQAARINARRNSPFGVAGSPQNGSEIRLLAQLDPDFITTLKPYQRWWWAA